MKGIARYAAAVALAALAGCAGAGEHHPGPHPGGEVEAPAGSAPEQELLALHERALEAHRRSDVELLLRDEAEDYVLSSAGEISRPSLAERRAMLGGFLASTRFEEYRDLTPPVVRVSRDGTLGWVVCRIQARGTQRGAGGETAPLAFVSSWIELYERRDGKWLRVGNVSNFAAR